MVYARSVCARVQCLCSIQDLKRRMGTEHKNTLLRAPHACFIDKSISKYVWYVLCVSVLHLYGVKWAI